MGIDLPFVLSRPLVPFPSDELGWSSLPPGRRKELAQNLARSLAPRNHLTYICKDEQGEGRVLEQNSFRFMSNSLKYIEDINRIRKGEELSSGTATFA